MRRKGRNHTLAFKAKAALAALKGDKTLAELAEDFDAYLNQIIELGGRLGYPGSTRFLTDNQSGL